MAAEEDHPELIVGERVVVGEGVVVVTGFVGERLALHRHSGQVRVDQVLASDEFEDDVRDTLLNPTVIVEVLSASTEAYDRGKKFFSHLAQHYGQPVHRRVIVYGVGHDAEEMLDAARPYLPD